MYSCIDTTVPNIRYRFQKNKVLREGERVLFLADNCAVLERSSGKSNVYWAVNLYDFRQKHLYSSIRQLTRNRYDHVTEQVLESTVNYLPEGYHRQTRHERAAWLLKEIFCHVYPEHGFAVREQQLSLALTILEGLLTGKITLAEAEVGTGKTHAYITAAVVFSLFSDSRQSILVSTSTIPLQQAIAREYLPRISEFLMEFRVIERPLTWIVRKGKSHYVCDLRLTDYCNTVGGWTETGFLNHSLLASLCEMDNEDIDLDRYPLSAYIKRKISVNHACDERCSRYQCCRYRQFEERCISGNHDFVITNHNYVFADKLAGKKKLPAYQALIFDEAHKLPDVARKMYGIQLGEKDLPRLIHSLHPNKIRDKVKRRQVMDCTMQLAKCNTLLFESLKKALPADPSQDEAARYPVRNTPADKIYLLKLANTLRILSTVCRGSFLPVEKQKHITRRCRELETTILLFLEEQEEYVFYLEQPDTETGYALRATPKTLQQDLYRDFWGAEPPVVLTSGTLSVRGCFSHIKKTLGLSYTPMRILETSQPSPFNYRENSMLYIPENLPFPDSTSIPYQSAIAEELYRLIRVSSGHSLILFTSYWLMEKVYAMLSERITDYPLFLMGRGRLDALERYKQSKNGVLFASDSCGEGLDVQGDTLSSLVIVKLPFAVPDPLTQYEQSLFDSLSDYLNSVTVPEMLIKLKQYAGRLIRTETDTGIISILDSRAAAGGKYREPIMQSLFDSTVTDSLYDVWAFLQNRKGEGYAK